MRKTHSSQVHTIPRDSTTARNVIQWLLDGDPSIRWQVMRDLLGMDEIAVEEERRKVESVGWGARLLSHQDTSGRWGGQLYSGKWVSTTYTLLLLRQMGLEPSNLQAQRGCRELLEGGFRSQGGISFARTVDVIDNGVTGMVLSLLAYFGYPDERLDVMAEYLINQQLSDGRWEPVPDNQQIRYAFDTTILILEGLHEYERKQPHCTSQVIEAQRKGREFLQKHKIFKSIPEDVELDKQITQFSFPPRWHYDVLVALDYFQACQAEKDERLREAITLLIEKHNPDATWDLQNRHAGKTFFEMEQAGKPSRWNTLRALRVLKWWNGILA